MEVIDNNLAADNLHAKEVEFCLQARVFSTNNPSYHPLANGNARPKVTRLCCRIESECNVGCLRIVRPRENVVGIGRGI